ncbi:MAG: Gfo/Idh/MocA family oxidoreductase [Kiritimatiellae bacterium]|nr:Gfo/Idh/MocA family oxidoreductase [Kiritimatiellia bacterium]
MMTRRKRYVQVGVGSRAWNYTVALVKTMKSTCELVGICDTNRGRMQLCNRKIVSDLQGKAVPMFLDTEFDAMIRRLKPDIVVVTSVDCTHDRYIVRAMDLGCDVVTEKPMTIDEKKCQRIVDAVNRSGRDLRVTFNCRYMPAMLQVKDLLMQGVIGKILSVDVHWILDVDHGASYFRRWHGEIGKSGGLLLHKATHHLDLVNWFLSANPVEVFAMGDRSFYGAQSGMVGRYGLQGHGERCLTCRRAKKCPFFMDIRKSAALREQYLKCEKYDGYIRDRCVFHKKVDIMDTMNLVVRYDNGAFLSYSLNTFTPYEGFRYAFNGNKGRLEFEHIGAPMTSQGKALPAKGLPAGMSIRLYPHFKPARSIPLRKFKGGHWGGDARLMADVFGTKSVKDPYMRAANYASGAMSILIGAAANKSMRTGQPVKITGLVKGLPPARLPKMKQW